MVARAASTRDIFTWLAKSWRIYKKRPLYLWGSFIVFGVVTIFPSYVSPYGRIFSGFMLPLVFAGGFIFMYRVVRYKRATYEDLFYVFYDTRLGSRMLPLSFISMFLWTSIGITELMERQPFQFQINHHLSQAITLMARGTNVIVLLGVTPIFLFSSLNLIQAIFLAFRSLKISPILFTLVWGGSIGAYWAAIRWPLFLIPVGAFLIVFWFVSFDGLFMIMEDPLGMSVKKSRRQKDSSSPIEREDQGDLESFEVFGENVEKTELVSADSWESRFNSEEDYYNQRYQSFDNQGTNVSESLFDDKTDELGEITQTKPGAKPRRS